MRTFTRHAALAVAALSGLLVATEAQALEVQFEGFYRARGRLFDTLSLDRALPASEGTSAWVQHRLWLRPRFVVSEDVAVFAEIRGLDGAYWGDEPYRAWDPVTGQDQELLYTDDLVPPEADDPLGAPVLDLSLWRAWGEVRSDYGHFSFGRMPLHWGLGIWQNDGLGLDADYGDTADRVQWDLLVEDVWVRLAVDVNAAGLVQLGDEAVSYSGVVGYRSERIRAGIQAHVRRVADPEFTLFTVDGAVDADLGSLAVRAEGIGQFGSGDLESGANDAQVSAFGAVVDLSLDTPALGVGLEGGFASGDGEDGDQSLHTFTFDRDYDLALVMFEQPMPTLAAAVTGDTASGRSYDQALTGVAVSNAIFIRPRVWRDLGHDLQVEAAFIGARVAKVPEELAARKSYGMEVDATLRWEPMDHVELAATGGVFLPGTFYREYSDEDGTYDSFDDPVYGVELTTRIRF